MGTGFLLTYAATMLDARLSVSLRPGVSLGSGIDIPDNGEGCLVHRQRCGKPLNAREILRPFEAKLVWRLLGPPAWRQVNEIIDSLLCDRGDLRHHWTALD